MKLRRISEGLLTEMPAGSLQGPIPGLRVLDGSDRIDFCVEVFEKADQLPMFRALNSPEGARVPNAPYALSIDDQNKINVVPAADQPVLPVDWLERIHSTAGSGTIIWLGDICAAKKPHLADEVKKNASDYIHVAGGWRRR